MAKKTVKARKATGVVRFKAGFPPEFSEIIRAKFGDKWHLALHILDDDDGGDRPERSAAVRKAEAAKASKGAKKTAKPAATGRKRSPKR
jgi:hypothetical protein